MSKKLKTAVVGGIIALVVGFAVSYGLIDQQTGDEIKNKSEEILSQDETAAPAPAPAPETAPAPSEGTAAQEQASPPAADAGSVDDAITEEPATQAPAPPTATEPAPQEPSAPAAGQAEQAPTQ